MYINGIIHNRRRRRRRRHSGRTCAFVCLVWYVMLCCCYCPAMLLTMLSFVLDARGCRYFFSSLFFSYDSSRQHTGALFVWTLLLMAINHWFGLFGYFACGWGGLLFSRARLWWKYCVVNGAHVKRWAAMCQFWRHAVCGAKIHRGNATDCEMGTST